MKKFIFIAIVALAGLIGAWTYYLVSNLNSIVATAIEKHGSEVSGTSVRVSGVDITIREGRGTISGLRVGNPEKYKAQDVFMLDDIVIDLDVASVRRDPIVIDEIRIRAPVIQAEIVADGKINVDEIRKRVQAHDGTSSEGQDGTQKKIRIQKFILEQGRVEVDASAVGVEKKTITLPEIRLTNVGGESGVSPDQVAKVILTTVAKRTTTEIARSEVHRLIEDQLGDSLADKAKGLLDKIGK